MKMSFLLVREKEENIDLNYNEDKNERVLKEYTFRTFKGMDKDIDNFC
jgi:hypothetical protein